MTELLLQSLDSGMDMNIAIIAIIVAFILGTTISTIYKFTGSGFVRSPAMSFTYMVTTMLITAILITLGNNIALSLGLIGSLSVIRFRTPVKDPEDMVFLFWAIATGLACGSGNFLFAVLLVGFIGVVVIVFAKQTLYNFVSNGYILVLDYREQQANNDEIESILNDQKMRWKLKSSLIDKDAQRFEVVFEIDHTRDVEQINQTISKIQKIKWINKASLLSADSYSVI